MDISFLLPTNRNPHFALTVANSINALETKYNYEILIYAPWQVDNIPKNVKLVLETTCYGPYIGYETLYKQSIGEYIYVFVDDHKACNISGYSLFNAVDYLQSKMFSNRKYKITSLATCNLKADPSHNPGPQRLPFKGELCGGHIVDVDIPEYTCMRFPVFHRDTINNYLGGYIYNPNMVYHAGDLWLGYWLGRHGEIGLECANAHIEHYQHMMDASFQQRDCKMFLDLVKNYNGNYIS